MIGAANYFGPRMWTGHYWPKFGADLAFPGVYRDLTATYRVDVDPQGPLTSYRLDSAGLRRKTMYRRNP